MWPTDGNGIHSTVDKLDVVRNCFQFSPQGVCYIVIFAIVSTDLSQDLGQDLGQNLDQDLGQDLGLALGQAIGQEFNTWVKRSRLRLRLGSRLR